MYSHKLYTTKLDTLEFDVHILNDDGSVFKLAENDLVWFAVKKDYSDESPLLYVEQNDLHFSIHCLTLDADTYKFEIGITFEDGKIITIINDGRLFVANKIREQNI